MKIGSHILIWILGLVILPIAAGSIVPATSDNEVNQTRWVQLLETQNLKNTSIQPNSVTSIVDATAKQLSIDGDLSFEANEPLMQTVDQHRKYSGDGILFGPSLSSAMLFQDGLQTQPIYRIKNQFYPPETNDIFLLLTTVEQEKAPWFIQPKFKSSNRLSGWKDSNSQYAANITYY